MLDLKELRQSCLKITRNNNVSALELEKRQLEWLLSDSTLSVMDRNIVNNRLDQLILIFQNKNFDTTNQDD